MAKALIGHVGGPDPRMIMEMRRLQERVRSLETEVLRLRAENDALAAGVSDAHLIILQTVARRGRAGTAGGVGRLRGAWVRGRRAATSPPV